MSFIIKMLRTVFYSLDSIVYGLIPSVYALLLQITRTSIFTQSEINKFAERVYALIGIFMLFKVSVSVINYVLNPDDFLDKEKGFANIIKRVILSLVMLVLAPFIFKFAFDLQTDILEENTIMNLVFGNPSSGTPGSSNDSVRTNNSSYADMAGRKIQFTLMYAFAQPNYQEFSGSNFDLSNCENTYMKDEETSNYVFRYSEVKQGASSYIYELNKDCWGTYDAENDVYVTDGYNGKLLQLFEENNEESAFQNYAQGVAQQSFSLFFRPEVIGAKSEDGRFLINYRFGISTAVGVATLYLFLMFCIDIAVRSIQWGFLQMISPIPILSYCDPKSSKDGMFKKWLDKCKKVYLDLFIRLFALYFGIYIISLVGTFRDVVTGEEISMMDNWILSIFMILGVLMFVKKLPDFLKETLGLEGSGTFKNIMHPFKKIEDEVLGGKAIAGAGKKAVGAVGGAAAGFGAGILSGRGFFSGLKTGIKGGMKGDKFGKNWSNSYSAGKNKAHQIAERNANGVSGMDVFSANVHNAMPWNSQSRAEEVKQVVEGYKAIQDAYKNYSNTLAGSDAIAKEMSNRMKAAHEAGDFDEETRWTKAFDERLKMVAANGGKMSLDMPDFGKVDVKDAVGKKIGERAANLADVIGDDGKIKSAFGKTIKDNDEMINAALNNYSKRMSDLVDYLNKEASSIAGFSKIDTIENGNLKKAMGQSKAVQANIESNDANRKIENVAKYTSNNNKK